MPWVSATTPEDRGAGDSLHGDDGAKVVPLEEHIHVTKAGLEQQFAVLQQLVGNEHVLERLALLGDLEIAIAAAAFEVIVELDELPIEQ